jgi:hypothetical protein
MTFVLLGKKVSAQKFAQKRYHKTKKYKKNERSFVDGNSCNRFRKHITVD